MTGAGDLRERLHFQRRAIGDDGFGGEATGEFETVFTCAARRRPLKGGEGVMASRLNGVQPYIVTVRQSSQTRSVTTAWRIVDARNPRRVMNITAISDPDGRRAWFDILAIEGGSGGQ